MKIPLQITSRNFELTDAIETAIREKALKLDQMFDQIMRCAVVVEIPHRNQQKGVLYNVRINITVPGTEIVVKREPHEDLYVSINNAFDTAQRQLQDAMSRRRGDVKYHEEAPRARIAKLFADEGYGFIATPEGREIYFHKNSVIGHDFEALQIGMPVRYIESVGEKGPQASTVKVD